jgi:Flp pilus assembly protein TadG
MPKFMARGQALVEFALILPVFILLLVGLLDVGRVVFAYNDASHAARDATRFASVSPLDCDSIFYVIQHQIQGDDAVTVAVSYRAIPSPSNQNPSWTNVCPAYNPNATYDNDPATGTMSNAVVPLVGGEIKVTVTNAVSLATPLISRLLGNTITVTGSSSMSVSFVPS